LAKIIKILQLLTLYCKYCVKNAGGLHEGKPCPKLTDLVWMARGVIIVHTVGLSKPINLEAPEIDFIYNKSLKIQKILILY